MDLSCSYKYYIIGCIWIIWAFSFSSLNIKNRILTLGKLCGISVYKAKLDQMFVFILELYKWLSAMLSARHRIIYWEMSPRENVINWKSVLFYFHLKINYFFRFKLAYVCGTLSVINHVNGIFLIQAKALRNLSIFELIFSQEYK